MKQARYEVRGPVPQDVIEAVDFTLPPLRPGEVLVEVLAAPINPSDVLTLTGEYGSLPPLPAVGGNEGVGRVAELGEGVTSLRKGQTVLLPVGCGTWTSHLIADARALIPLPEGADPVQLSMLTVNPPTAKLLLEEIVPLKPGDWVLQNVANSAVGGYLIQLANARGVRTVNVVRRQSAVDGVKKLGAEVVLVDGDDLPMRVAQATGGAKVMYAIDAVGGEATERLARSLAPGGTVVNYGGMSGEHCVISQGSLIFRGISLRGFWLARWFKTADEKRRAALFGELVSMVASGRLFAPVQAAYGLHAIKQAVAAAAAGGRSGKIVLLPNGA